jgi:hypothetical protein
MIRPVLFDRKTWVPSLEAFAQDCELLVLPVPLVPRGWFVATRSFARSGDCHVLVFTCTSTRAGLGLSANTEVVHKADQKTIPSCVDHQT